MPDSRHVLVVIDGMSRFPAAKIVSGTSAGPVLKALNSIYTDYGNPKSHRTDNGPPFDSNAIEEFSKGRDVKHIKTFPYHPQANPAETFMKPLGKSMKIAHYNKLMMRGGYKGNLPGTKPTSDQEVERAKEKDQSGKNERTERINNSTHRQPHELAVGSYVYTKNNQRTKF